VAVPAVEGTSLVVVETEAVFQLAVVMFDPPAQLHEPYETTERDVGGQG